MPLFGAPTSQPTASSNEIWQVAEAFMPILCSRPDVVTPLRAPGRPSSLGSSFGTRKRLMPLIPFGASGSRASTRWMMFSVRSWSPEEMKILEPVTAKLPSSRGTARVRSRPRSVPQCDSVRHIVPDQVPSTIFGRKRRFSSSDA